MKRFTRKRALVCGAATFVTAAVVLVASLIINNFSAFAATVNVQYSGVGGKYNSNYFTVDGNPAYCSWHVRSVPTGSVSQLRNIDVNSSNATALDKLVYKVIYYGQINGYTHQQIAIAVNNANNKLAAAGSKPSWQNPGWSGYNFGYVITDGHVNGASKDTTGISKSDLLTLAEQSNLPVGTNMNLIIWSNGNTNYQNLSQITYSDVVPEKFNISVVKNWNDTDTTDPNGVFNAFTVNSNPAIVPHSADIRISATVNVSYNGNTQVLKTGILDRGNNYTMTQNDISCHDVKSQKFNVENDYTCNGLTLSTTETVINPIYSNTFSSSISPQTANVTNGETAEFIIDNEFYTTFVNVSKTWNDNDTLENDERPHYITFDVKYRVANSTVDEWAQFKRYEKLEISCAVAKNTQLSDEAKTDICYNNPELFNFDNLPAFLKIGNEYKLVEYKAFEVALYDANQNDVTSLYEKTETDMTISTSGDVRTTNQAMTNSDLTSVPVWKVWYGDRNYPNDRPQSITAVLMCGNQEVLDASGNRRTIELSAANDWEGEFTGLSKQACDNYGVVETVVPEHYTSDNNGTATFENGIWVLRNYHDVDVKVKKTWTGVTDNNPDVASLTVGLTCSDNKNEVIDSATLSDDNNWEYTWSDRDYKECGDDGDEYYVKEIGYNGSYTLSGVVITQDNDGTWVYTLNNVKNINIPVTKAWASRSDDIRTTEVTAVLLCEDPSSGDVNPYQYSDGSVAKLTLNAGNDWSGTFANITNNAYNSCKSFDIAEESSDGNTLYAEDEIVSAKTASNEDFKLKVHYTGNASQGFTITNEQVIDIPVSKQWDDEGDNLANDRPIDIVAILYCVNGNNKIVKKTTTLSANNNWTDTWTNLTVSDCDSYEVEEAPYSSHGYDTSYTYEGTVAGNETDGFVITNTKYVSIPVVKVWNYRDTTTIPSSVQVTLTCNNEDYGSPVTLTDNYVNPYGAWVYTGFNNIKASECPTGFGVREIVPQGANYEPVYATLSDGKKTRRITNTEQINIPVEKVWDTNRSIDNLPASVDVSLYCDDTLVETKTLYKADNYAGEFGPFAKGSCEGEYSVSEDNQIAGFTSSYSGNDVEGFQVINTEYTHLEVNKTWEQRDTTEVPVSLSLQLVCLDNDTETQIGNPVRIYPDENGIWSYDFTGLKTSDCNNYDVKEYLGYIYNYSESEHTKVDLTTVNLTNKEIIYVPVEKAWNADASEDLPENIDVSLYCGDEKVDTMTLQKRLGYYGLFGPFYFDACSQGYSVTEDTEIEGFEPTIVSNEDGSFSITNTKQYDINVSKNWEVVPGRQIELPSSITVALWCETTNSEVSNKRITLSSPNYSNGWTGLSYADCASYGVREVAADGTTILSTVGDRYNDFFFYGGVSGSAAEGFTLTNTYDGIEISGTKTWNFADVNGNVQTESKRPSQISVKLLQNGSVIDTVAVSADNDGNWNYSFDDQPKYDAEGNEYVYTVDEALVTYYQKTVDGYNITNQYAPEYTSVTASKDWAALKDTTLPAQVEVRLYCGTTDLNQAKYITKASNWASVTWENLPVDGCDDGYNVKEITPAGFAPSVAVVGDTNYNFTNSEEVDIPVSKTWVKRESTSLPESVTVGLYCTVDGNKTKLDEQTLSEANNWSYTWTDRNVKNDNCQGGAYSVDEISTVPNFKKTSVDYTTANGYVITNTETTSQKVIKVWNGDTDQNRPGSITAELMCGDTVKKTQILSEANNLDHDNTWEFTWEDLLISDCEQGYTVRESFNIPNYKTSYETLEDGTVVITNERTTSQKVIKVWKNDDKTKRPGYIEASLKCGDKVIETVKLSEENNLDGDDTWEYEWNDLLVSECEEGYTVDEDVNIPNYHKTVTVLEDGTVVITNEFDNPDTSDKKFGLGGIIGVSTAAVLIAGVFVSRKFIGRR